MYTIYIHKNNLDCSIQLYSLSFFFFFIIIIIQLNQQNHLDVVDKVILFLVHHLNDSQSIHLIVFELLLVVSYLLVLIWVEYYHLQVLYIIG